MVDVNSIKRDTDFDPDWRVPPGDLIAELLQELKLSVEDASGVVGFDLHPLLTARPVALTEAMAEGLAKLRGTKEYWLRLEENYRRPQKSVPQST